MRVFYAVGESTNAYQLPPTSRLWSANLLGALRTLPHFDVVPFSRDPQALIVMDGPPSSPARRAARASLEAALVAEVKAAHAERPLDLFFSYFWSEMCGPETVREIRALGIVTVNWFCNAAHQFELIRDLAPAFDFSLVPERDRLEDYRRAGARPIYCQEAANPDVYRPHDVAQDLDVSFVGQAYGERPALVRRLADAGLDVRAFGPGWEAFAVRARRRARAGHAVRRALYSKLGERWYGRLRRVLRRPPAPPPATHVPRRHLGGILSDEELVATFSRSKVNLGFSACGDTRGPARQVQLRLRDFEVPMSGGFYLVEYMQELEQFFEVGKEVVCYRDPDDLVDKVRYYLERPAEREAIRAAGRARALRDHTWQRRLTEAFRAMGLPAAAPPELAGGVDAFTPR